MPDADESVITEYLPGLDSDGYHVNRSNNSYRPALLSLSTTLVSLSASISLLYGLPNVRNFTSM